MKHLSAFPTRRQNQIPNLPGEALDHLMSLCYETLPHSEREQIFQEVGRRLGRVAWRRYRLAYRLGPRPTVKDAVQCITGLEELWGWSCTILQQTEEHVSVVAPPLFPFAMEAIAGSDRPPIVSLMTSGLFEGITEDAFGYGKVCSLPDDGPLRTNRRYVIYLHPAPASTAVQEIVGRRRSLDMSRVHVHENGDELGQLSRRERQVLRCVGEGFTNKEIAAELGISVRTVEGHVSRVCVKLDLRRRADLIRCSLRHKLATL